MKLFRPHFVLIVLLYCGIAAGQDIASIPNFGFGDDTGLSVPGYNVHAPFLQRLLSLSDEQREQILRITHELEDAIFPLTLEALQKQWELERAFRAHPPDQAAIMVISADFERIEGRFASVVAEHRKMARAIFGWEQLIVLGKLEAALELYPAAREAADLNLIAEPVPEIMDTDPGGLVPEATAATAGSGKGLARLLAMQKILGRAVEPAR